MLAIGRALMGQPRLLVFDEPSLGLAPTLVTEILSAIQRLHAEGIPTLLVVKRGREVDRIVGVQPQTDIARRVERAIA